MGDAGGRKGARWRTGVLVSALGVGAVVGAAPATAAPAPGAGSAVVAAAASLPAAPANFSAIVKDQKLQFNFTVPAAAGPKVTGYEISIDNAATWAPIETTAAGTDFDGSAVRSGFIFDPAEDVVYRVALRAVSADGPGPASQVASTAPSYYGGVRRLSGPERVATSVSVSEDLFPTNASAPAAVITTSATYADALAGAALAAQVGGPLLLTSPTALQTPVATEIRRVVKAGGTIYVLGDTGAVTANVEKTLKSSFAVTRLAGADRYATALAVASTMRALGAKGPAYLATGTNYPDGLSVSALAAHTDGLVILSNDRALDAATRAWIGKDDPTGIRTVPVGGPAASAAASAGLPASTRSKAIVGADRYDTSHLIAVAYGPFQPLVATRPDNAKLGLATGANWPDALVGAAAMGHLDGPLLLTDGAAAQLHPTIAQDVSTFDNQGSEFVDALVFGGSDVLSDDLAEELGRILPESGP